MEEKRTSPLKAIRLKCLDCSCGSSNEVKLCPAEKCPLYPFREGKNPNIGPRGWTEERRELQRQRMAQNIHADNEYKYDNEDDVEDGDLAQITADKKLKLLGGELGKGVIFLTEQQISVLLEEMGIEAFDYYVEKLADYIIDTGHKPTNHYATIRKWWKEDSQLTFRFRKGTQLKATDKDLKFSKENHPKAQPRWFEAAKERDLDEWRKAVARSMDKK